MKSIKKLIAKILCVGMVMIFLVGCGTRGGFDIDENATLSMRDSEIVHSVLSKMLFDNFPIWGVGIGLYNRIIISIKRYDEESEEVINEILVFINETINNHPSLRGMDINLGAFRFETAGPIIRVPVDDYYDVPEGLPVMHLTNMTPYGLSFFFINETEMEFIYGSDFRIYAREGNMWRLLNPAMWFTSEGISMQPLTTTQSRNVDWSWYFEGEGLPPGEYKFTKGFHFSRAPGDFDAFTASQRFMLE
ncbi:MAG: hypothetical protein FWC67_05235 [Defluviitaleaceae bacterium]|nr:hypothetical protein [Defluviitaleaceae bacterium]